MLHSVDTYYWWLLQLDTVASYSRIRESNSGWSSLLSHTSQQRSRVLYKLPYCQLFQHQWSCQLLGPHAASLRLSFSLLSIWGSLARVICGLEIWERVVDWKLIYKMENRDIHAVNIAKTNIKVKLGEQWYIWEIMLWNVEAPNKYCFRRLYLWNPRVMIFGS